MGSFQKQKGQMTCDYCPPGMRCTTTGLANPDKDCDYGTFCPLGTGTDGEKCPSGTYTDFSNATSYDDCVNCPAGVYCDHASGNTFMEEDRKPADCPKGNYCLERTPASTTYPCPAGSFSDRERIINSTQCSNCTAGYFCPTGLDSEPGANLICPPGHFCPEGTAGENADDARIPACPDGTYLEETGKSRVEDCLVCPPGEYCGQGVGTGTKCPDGTYSSEEGISSLADCINCPGGYFCASENDDPILEPLPCGEGTYSRPKQSECQDCLQGHYCDLNTTSEEAMIYYKVCPEGSYCPNGTDHVPDLVNDECPIGYWCAKGDVKAYGGEPQACPAGTYGTRTGLKNAFECEPCPAGVYCPNEATVCQNRQIGDTGEYDADCGWVVCDAGHYCETGSIDQKQCGPGFYRSESTVQAAVNQTSCSICESGFYCDEAGMSEDDMRNKPCPEGYYCAPGSILPEACDAGTYGDSTEFKTSRQCISCDPGHYCPNRGMTKAEIQNYECSAGFYCKRGAKYQNPIDGISGDKCPKGRFCPQGADGPQNCDPGTFTPFEGATQKTDCTECYPGFYCPGDANSDAMLPCVEGFYCEPGSKSETELKECSEGHYCPQQPLMDENLSVLTENIGALHEIPCEPGTFAEAKGKAVCDPCPAGQWCPFSKMTVTYECPAGFYCLLGSVDPTPCETGSYNPDTGSSTEQQCRKCPRGNYCNSAGLSVPKPCPDGYNCNQEGIVNPFGDDTFACAAGKTCTSNEDGTTVEECRPGEFNPRTYGHPTEDCLECTPGKACTKSGLVSPDDDCDAKHYCGGGADRTSPSGSTGAVQPCGYGYYCELGSPAQLPCPIGTYDPSASQPLDQCSTCLEGNYCEGTIATNSKNPQGVMNICPQGATCAAGSLYPLLCEPGTYNDQYQQAGNCSSCTENHFCPGIGQQVVNDNQVCSPGFYCDQGKSTPTPTDGYCDEGEFCTGDASPESCFEGSIGTAQWLESSTDCTQCPGGHFCDATITMWTDIWSSTGYSEDNRCTEGYYCKSGCRVPEPQSSQDCDRSISLTGGQCRSTEKYCPEATMDQIICPENTYRKSDSLVCTDCEQGYYCTQGRRSSCPRGHYCPGGQSGKIPCEPGTFSRTSAAVDSTTCIPCTAGYFCPEYGMSILTNEFKCDEGFFCGEGTKYKRPKTDGTLRGPCPKGTYCVQGSAVPTECDVGKFCDREGLGEPTGFCEPGYYCNGGSDSSTPHDANDNAILCPAGYFCPNELTMEDKQLCPAGRFSPSSVEGLRAVEDCMICPAGFYCNGEVPSDPSLIPEPVECPAGLVCPTGSKSSGQSGSNDCDWKEETENGLFMTTCPKGHRCPEGTADAQPCPAGTWTDSCGRSQCSDCQERYFCDQGAEAMTECAIGSFCPRKTGSPIPCPPGTYGVESGVCKACDAGKYCKYPENPNDPNLDTVGLTAPTGDCANGYECIQGAFTDKPMDGVTGRLCPQGYYCQAGLKTPCPKDYYGDREGLKSEIECTLCPNGFDCQTEGISDLTQHYCPAGYFCLEGQEPQKCQTEGRYCPIGTGQVDGYACPPGLWSDQRDGEDVNAFCQNCPPTFACDTENDTAVKIPCPDGYYCPGASSTTTAKGCPIGSYGRTTGLSNIRQCTDCLAGFYCPYATGPVGSSRPPKECEDGFACNRAAITPTPDGLDGTENRPCPAGNFCPKGLQTKCPIGTYLPTEGGENQDDCLPCPAGFYCESEGMTTYNTYDKCAPGYFCFAFASKYRPSNDNSSNFGICTEGHYCPDGASHEYQCKEGFYNDEQGQETCQNECLAGYFCPPGSTSGEGQRCPHGYQCDEAETSLTLRPCASGYYDNTEANDTIGLSGGECSSCPPGKYCPYEANTKDDIESNLCDNGFYCTNEFEPGSWTKRPYCSDDLERSIYCERTFFGSICEIGAVCDVGSVTMEPCTENKFCPHYGIDPSLFTSSEYDCAAGYHCQSGATVPNPMNDESFNEVGTGEVCQNDWYCGSGSSPTLCLDDTYNPQLGIGSQSECKDCPPGQVCKQNGDLDGIDQTDCPPGEYCLNGGKVDCSDGFVCEEGAQVEEPCHYGLFFNGDRTQCAACEVGKYCDGVSKEEDSSPDSFGPVNDPADCVPGYDCSTGNRLKLENGCPKGQIGRNGACEACPEGQYCPSVATGELSTVDCAPGHVCTGGALEPFGETGPGDVANECPEGQYCENGQVIDCPNGRYNNQTRSTSVDSCLPCPAGYLCQGLKVTDISNSICKEGYYCPPEGYCATDDADCSRADGQDAGDDFENDCGQYKFCEAGSAFPTVCKFAQYNNDALNAKECACCDGNSLDADGECTVADSSSNSGICQNGQKTDDCPLGSYCTKGTAVLCDAGTIGVPNPPDDSPEESCKLCPEGFYCPRTVSALVNPSQCSAGYICLQGSPIPRPEFGAGDADLSYGYRCPAGHFCEAGATEPTKCKPGTFRENEAGASEDDCSPCPTGYFCPDEGMTKGDVNRTQPGFYSPPGQDAPIICAVGHYCPDGFAQIECKGGEFQQKEGQDSCELCLGGLYCPEDGSGPIVCPAGAYCLNGTETPEYCDKGYYSDKTGLSSNQCELCPEGKACPYLDTTSSTYVDCDDGYFCPPGSSDFRAYECQEGYYCDEGVQILCPAGKACTDKGLSQPNYDCFPGYYCPEGSTSPELASNICPPGYYCPEGTAEFSQFNCSAGTYNQFEGQPGDEACIPCRPGFYCPNDAMSTYEDYPCEEGYFCPAGTLEMNQENICKKGQMCPRGSIVPIPCPDGFYNDEEGQFECKICDAGFYCSRIETTPEEFALGAEEGTSCPLGYYCPDQTSIPEPCPRGTLGLSTELAAADECSECPPGYYCMYVGSSEPTGRCAKGFYCNDDRETFDTPTPAGFECPENYFCELGADEPTPCIEGTYRDKKEGHSQDSCAQCPPGKF